MSARADEGFFGRLNREVNVVMADVRRRHALRHLGDTRAQDAAVRHLVALTEEERMLVMSAFCRGCGALQSGARRCQCENDE